MKTVKRSFEKRKSIQGIMLVLPWIIGFMLFTAYPILYSIYLSFNKVLITPKGIQATMIRFDNFRRALFTDPEFLTQLMIFIRVLVFAVPVIVVFALFMAMLINQPIKGRGFFRSIFFLPVIITSGEVVKELFAQGAGSVPLVSQYGIMDYINATLPPFFAAPLVQVVEQLIIMLWFSGVQILIFLAGLQKINVSIYEAAFVDGASPWEAFWKITLPFLKPFIMVNTIYTIINLCTSNLNGVIEKIRYEMFRVETGFGYATAIAWLYFLSIFILILLVALMWRDEKRTEKKVRRRRKAA